jgi:hypothetical protein
VAIVTLVGLGPVGLESAQAGRPVALYRDPTGGFHRLSPRAFRKLTSVRFLRVRPDRKSYRVRPDEPVSKLTLRDVERSPARLARILNETPQADLRALYGADVRGGRGAKLYLSGNATYAGEAIAPGRLIGEYTGLMGAHPRGPGRLYSIWVDGKGRTGAPAVEAYRDGNLTRWINSSARPNAKWLVLEMGGSKHVIIVATRPIAPHDQIFLDYATSLDRVELPRTWQPGAVEAPRPN